MPETSPFASRRTALHVAFFVSGAAALVYEVLWMRRLAVALGATAPATAATLSALFLGLASGSALFGALVHRARHPLRLFALLEAGVAATALLVEPLLSVLLPAFAGAASSLAARMAAAMIAILPAAILMGGTLPVLAEAMLPARRGLGITGGGLYAANTIGAAAGAIAAPAVLLPAFGAAGTLSIAVGASLSIAVAALVIGTASGSDVPRQTPDDPGRAHYAASAAPWLLAAAFFSGCVTLAIEVLGTRTLALVHENSVYSFATVLSVFLAGLGLGAWGVRALLSRGIPARRIAGAGWIGAGILVVAMPAVFHAMTSGLRYAGGTGDLLRHEIGLAVLAAATMLPAALLAGSVLPALMEMSGRRSSAGAELGTLLAANTFGAIAGPLIAVFLLGPRLGLWWSIVLCGLAMMAAGEATLSGGLRARLPLRLVLYASAAAIVILWRPGDLPRVRVAAEEQVISLREGPFGTTAVVESDGHRRLMLNNYYVLGGTASLGEERLQTHLPLLLHPDPRRVAFLGLGTGITAGASLFHPVREVVAMELVGDVVAAAREDFREANRGVPDDPRVTILVQDARTGLRDFPGRFDVIIGDLVVPWRRGEAALYTKESFESARGALAEGGIFCQWVPLFQLSRDAYFSIAATFLDVFPHAVLFKGDFRAGEPAVALVGIASGDPIETESVARRGSDYAAAADPANPYLFDPAGVWVYLAGPLSADDDEMRAAARNTDSHPLVELETPRTQFGPGRDALFTAEPLRRYFEKLLVRPVAGTPLGRLDAEALRTREAGYEIWSASLLEMQGHRAEADALGLAGLSKLPEPLRRILIPPAATP